MITCTDCPFRFRNICRHPDNGKGKKQSKVLSPKFYPKPPAWCKRKIKNL